MAELAALRAKLKDRQVKEGALGTVDAAICLDLELLSELRTLEQRRALEAATATIGDPDSLAGAVTVESASDLDALIEEKRGEIKAATIVVVFRALSSVRYQEVVNRFDDPDESQRAEFLSALVDACFRDAWNEGEKVVGLAWSEIAPEISEGEFEDIAGKVFELNKRRQDIPLSLKPSRPTRA